MTWGSFQDDIWEKFMCHLGINSCQFILLLLAHNQKGHGVLPFWLYSCNPWKNFPNLFGENLREDIVLCSFIVVLKREICINKNFFLSAARHCDILVWLRVISYHGVSDDTKIIQSCHLWTGCVPPQIVKFWTLLGSWARKKLLNILNLRSFFLSASKNDALNPPLDVIGTKRTATESIGLTRLLWRQLKERSWLICLSL